MTEQQGIEVLAHLDRIHWLLIGLILCNAWILGGVIWRVICYAKGSGSLWAIGLVVLVGAGTAHAQPTEFIIKPGTLGSGYEPHSGHNPPSELLSISKVGGGVYSLEFSVSSGSGGAVVLITTPSFYTVDPSSTEHQYGINGPSGVTFIGDFPIYGNISPGPRLLVRQGVNAWEFELFAPPGSGNSWNNVERFLTLGGYTVYSGSGAPDWTQPYELSVVIHVNDTAAHPDPNTLTISKFWVHLSGGDGEDETGDDGGGGDPGDGGGGGGKPPGDTGGDPDDGTEDPDPEKKEPPETEEPEPGAGDNPCWADLEQKIRDKFEIDKPTIGASDHRYEIKLRIGALEGDALERSYYIPLKIDESWEPGVALVKFLGWARNIMILAILFTLFRSIMWDIVQW